MDKKSDRLWMWIFVFLGLYVLTQIFLAIVALVALNQKG